MENASKALLIGGSILIGLVLIALLVSTFGNISTFQQSQISKEEEAEIIKFNEQYTKYLNQYVYGTDVISVINKSVAIDNKGYDMTVTIKFIEKYEYEGYVEVFKNGKKRWEEQKITIEAGDEVVIEDGVVQDKNMESFINNIGETDLNTRAFKCVYIGYGSDGRVNSIRFEEKEWSPLWEDET